MLCEKKNAKGLFGTARHLDGEVVEEEADEAGREGVVLVDGLLDDGLHIRARLAVVARVQAGRPRASPRPAACRSHCWPTPGRRTQRDRVPRRRRPPASSSCSQLGFEASRMDRLTWTCLSLM
jgi:hypothetical protein